MIPKITIDMLISEPSFAVGLAMLFLGTILFFVAFWKFIRLGSAPRTFTLPADAGPQDEISENFPDAAPEPEPSAPEPVISPPDEPKPMAATRPFRERSADETVILPAGVSDMQAQLEIAISQIRSLNRKIHELETQIERLSDHAAVQLEPNELKEPPMNAGEFSQKLLKVVEHVIVLEREVARLKSAGPAPVADETEAPAPPRSGPPIMPL